ncbi:hypothetical protein Q3G72_032022 [Acer saccharum]|nr:hypothetical protein Q3G72_032022 [Acer saccharum]
MPDVTSQGAGPSAAAEVEAILKACQCCESVNCPAGVPVVIESDSMSAISWVNGVNGVDGVGNVRFLESIMEIREIFSKLKSKVVVRFVPRSSNAAADFIAKQGDVNGLDQMVWAS